MNFEKTIRILIVIIAALIIAIAAVILGKSCPGSEPPSPSAQPTSSPEPTATVAPQPSLTPEETETASPQSTTETDTDAPTQSPEPVTDVAKVVTEGDLNAVYARLEQLKGLKAADPSVTIILLDVGHGGFDPGASGIDTGVKESELNLAIARLVAEKLGEKGYYVFMTRMDEYAVGSSKQDDMAARTAMMKNDIFTVAISIHMNSFPNDRTVKGTRVYFYKSGNAYSGRGMSLAKTIMQSVADATAQEYRDGNVVGDDLMVVREPLCASALVECGFLSNHEEEASLQLSAYQQLIAASIADGVQSYLTNP